MDWFAVMLSLELPQRPRGWSHYGLAVGYHWLHLGLGFSRWRRSFRFLLGPRGQPGVNLVPRWLFRKENIRQRAFDGVHKLFHTSRRPEDQFKDKDAPEHKSLKLPEFFLESWVVGSANRSRFNLPLGQEIGTLFKSGRANIAADHHDDAGRQRFSASGLVGGDAVDIVSQTLTWRDEDCTQVVFLKDKNRRLSINRLDIIRVNLEKVNKLARKFIKTGVRL